MNPELQRIYDNVPEDRPKSRLEPYRELILRWRRQGRSHRRIAGFLREECKVRVSGEAVRKFVNLRSRPRKAQPDLEIEPATVQPVERSSAAVSAVERIPRMSIEERRAQADAIRANFKPLFAKQEIKPLFDYDPDKPLTLKPKEK